MKLFLTDRFFMLSTNSTEILTSSFTISLFNGLRIRTDHFAIAWWAGLYISKLGRRGKPLSCVFVRPYSLTFIGSIFLEFLKNFFIIKRYLIRFSELISWYMVDYNWECKICICFQFPNMIIPLYFPDISELLISVFKKYDIVTKYNKRLCKLYSTTVC